MTLNSPSKFYFQHLGILKQLYLANIKLYYYVVKLYTYIQQGNYMSYVEIICSNRQNFARM